MTLLRATVFLLFIALPCYGQSPIKIVGQEGDEKFYPLLNSIYLSMGLQPEFTLQPSARALASVNSGKYAAEIGRIPDIAGDYTNIIYSTEPLLRVELVALVKRHSKIHLGSAEDLHNYRVANLIGMSVAEAYLKESGLKSTSVSTHKQLAAMLNRGRVDIVNMGTAFSDAEVFAVGKNAMTIKQYYVYHIFNKNYLHLKDEFDKQLKKAKQDGRYQQLLLSTY